MKKARKPRNKKDKSSEHKLSESFQKMAIEKVDKGFNGPQFSMPVEEATEMST